ncbi:hypothetical protein CPB85DRAFT_1257959 [Mucidula mucida]|nr:hypothetical protein CPB85DRAFT_1257959 [Mucidula mucida]
MTIINSLWTVLVDGQESKRRLTSTTNNPSNHMPVPQIPLEILQVILQIIWDDKLCARQRIQFMTLCPLVNKEWRATYDMLASRDVYIPSMQYLHYLLRIIATGQSHVHIASHFALRTRHVIVQTFRSYTNPWHYFALQDSIADNDAYSKMTSQLAHSSFTGLHRCFPAATHLVFEAIITFDNADFTFNDTSVPSYLGLRVQLDDRSTVTAEWRVDSRIPISQEDWDWTYRRDMARDVSRTRFRGCSGLKTTAFGVQGIMGPGAVRRRAAAGYYSFKLFILAHWFHDEAAHVKRRARAVLNAAPKSIAKASGYWRFYDVVLAACVLTAGLPLVVGLAFFVFKLLVALCAMSTLTGIHRLTVGAFTTSLLPHW